MEQPHNHTPPLTHTHKPNTGAAKERQRGRGEGGEEVPPTWSADMRYNKGMNSEISWKAPACTYACAITAVILRTPPRPPSASAKPCFLPLLADRKP
jgi:hypothetical protein